MTLSPVPDEDALTATEAGAPRVSGGNVGGDPAKSTLKEVRLAKIARRRERLQRRRTRPSFTLLLELAGAVLGIALVATLALAWRLNQGPIPLAGLERPIQEALSAADSAETVEVGAVSLAWSAPWRSLIVVLDDVVSRDGDGAELARSARMELGLSLQALLLGRLEPSRIAAEGGLYSLVLRPDGSVAFGAGPPDSVASRPPLPADADRLETVLTELRRALGDRGTGSRLREAKITGARFMFLDQASRVAWEAPSLDLAIARNRDSLALRTRGRLDQAGTPATFDIGIVGQSALRDAKITVALDGLVPERLLPPDLLGPLAGLTTPVNVEATATIDADQGLREANASLLLGEGVLVRAGQRFPVRAGTLRLAYDPASDALTIAEARFDTAPFAIDATGRINQPANLWTEGTSAVALSARRLALPESDAFDRAVEARDVTLTGTTNGQRGTFDVSAFSAKLGAATVTLAGRLTASKRDSGGTPGIALNGKINGTLPVRDVLAFWPKVAAPDARRWVDESMIAGDITGGNVAVNVPADVRGVLKDDALSIAFGFARARVRYLKTMGDLTDVSGTAVLRGNSFSLKAPLGRMGPLMLTNGTVEIPRLNPGGTPATVKVRMAGDADGFATELDRPPLSIFSGQGIAASAVSGTGAIDLTISFPLLNQIPEDSIIWSIDGSFAGAGLRDAFLGLDVADGRIAIKGQNDLLSITGPARLGGVPLDIVWRDDRRTETDTPTLVLATGRASQAERNRLVPGLGSYVSGDVGLDIRATGDGLKITGAVAIADLKDAGLRTGRGDWSKPPGAPARLSLRAFPAEDGSWAVRDIRGDGTGMSVAGSADLDRNGAIRSARFERLRFDALADVSLTATRSGEALDVAVKGQYLDLGPFLGPLLAAPPAGAASPSPPARATPTNLRLETAEATLPGGAAVTRLSLDASLLGRDVRTATLSARSKAGPTNATIRPGANGLRTLRATTSDLPLIAGLFARNAPLTGGKATLEGTLPQGSRAGALQLVAENLVVRRDDGGSWNFTRATAPLSWAGPRITVGEARAAGPTVGVTATGIIDLATRQLDLQGAMVPAYGLNAALGSVPLLGGMLVSRPGEGVFAVTYRVEGPFTAPRLRTNPLSALAPGFMRRIFEEPGPRAAAAGQITDN